MRLNIKGPADTDLKIYITPDSLNNYGHNHGQANTNRPHGWVAKQNESNFPPNVGQSGFESGGTIKYSSFADPSSLTVTTDHEGDAHVFYTAPEICGTERISVSTTESDPNLRVVESLIATIKADLSLSFIRLQATSEIALTGDGRPLHIMTPIGVRWT